MKAINIVGQKFNRWTILSRAENHPISGSAQFLCQCDCGNKTIIPGTSIRKGHSKSCGCLRDELASKRMQGVKFGLKHGLYGTKIYTTWRAMLQRCEDTNSSGYYKYGAKGIKVCKRWHNIKNFVSDMGFPPSPKHSIDRIKNHGDYKPSNCKWSTLIEQMNNHSLNVFISYNGEANTIAQWACKLNLNYKALRKRIRTFHWTIERSLNTPTKTPYKPRCEYPR